MSFDPEYIKTLRNAKSEPDYCKQLRQRNLHSAKQKGLEEMTKLERENEKAWRLDPINGRR
ncbi:TPA: hypothetical protein RQK28_000694 [Vibrio vulnificus]|nr:hypothetical protein [Vibrio vulnificus]